MTVKHGYFGKFEITTYHIAGKKKSLSSHEEVEVWRDQPRSDVQFKDLEKWQASPISLGFVVLTTSVGIMGHEEARQKHTGGKTLGFFV